MTSEERARIVVALDHDARQPQHAIEMGLRNLRLIASDLEAGRVAPESMGALMQRLKVEIASVQAAARQIVDTQQDLADAIRLEFDDTRPVPRTIRADELIERVRKSNRALAASIKLRAASSRLAFVADERWVERVLSNLVSNAIRHSGGDRILIGARRRDEDIVFEVRDNGRGMAPDKVARVFEPLKFPSVSPIGYSAARSGLGLYNVRLFTERMGGTVDCVSAPGRGTLFQVRLPGPLDRIERPLRLRSSPVAYQARNKVVAVLDDDKQVLRTTERLFEQLGIEVYADHDPLRWLNVVLDLKRMPDLFLLDFQLKGQDCSVLMFFVFGKCFD
jgi:signal transduction histidine kinase